MTSEPTKRDAFLEHGFKILTAGVIVLLVGATLVYHSLEDWSWVDSFYFSAVAVTTVGFGDIAPSTNASKLFTVLFIFTGVGVITAYLNLSLRRMSLRVSRHRAQG